jgi:DNA-directed RNA polymerase subunit M/transcription elongation factor TFIIS
MRLEEIKAKENEDYNGLFKCKKCGTNKVTYTQAQTRSADGAFYFRLLRLLLTDATVQNP